MKAPFPWFGGKSRAAEIIWARFGNTPNYVEPFFGSGAVLLRRPHAAGNEIVNDLDCYVANAWRAIQAVPDKVAQWCDWPVNEADLHARHRWLHGQKEFRVRMEHEPAFFDAKIAGWWCWGLSCWIGDNFCRPTEQDSLPHLTGGKGVARKVPHLTGGKAEMITDDDEANELAASPAPDGRSRRGEESIPRQIPALVGTYGATTHTGQPHGKGVGGKQSEALRAWFAELASRLRFTKVCCGDWQRVCTKVATFGQGITAVLLDPPYDAGDSHDDVYGEMSRGVSAGVREWALANGTNPELRIALCGYDDEHAMPPEWECVAWKAAGGYGNQSGNENNKRERIWFSPACLRPELDLFSQA